MRNTCPSSNGGNLAVGGKRLSCTRAFLLSLPDRLFIHSMFGLRYRVAPHSSETGRRFRAEQAVLIYFVSFLVEVLPSVERTLPVFPSREFFSRRGFLRLMETEREKFDRVVFYSCLFLFCSNVFS